MRRNTRRPGRIPGGLQALPRPLGPLVPEGANYGAERQNVIDFSQYRVLRVSAMPAKKAKPAERPPRTGRVKPTLQLKGVATNDDTALEREADRMGARASGHLEPIWWRVSVIKKKMVYLGRVRAADKASAAVKANKEFTSLTDHERARLVIEQG